MAALMSLAGLLSAPGGVVFLHICQVFGDVGFVHQQPVVQGHGAVFGVAAGVEPGGVGQGAD